MFTDEELELLDKMLRATPIQGTVETLPQILARVAALLQKINAELQASLDAQSYAASHPND